MIVMQFSIQGESFIEQTTGPWQMSCVYILVSKRKTFLSILMPSVICACFSQLVDHYGT